MTSTPAIMHHHSACRFIYTFGVCCEDPWQACGRADQTLDHSCTCTWHTLHACMDVKQSFHAFRATCSC
jgi:hypothetical protein